MPNNIAKSTQIVVEAHNSAMTKRERQVKKQLIKLLIDDGRGHHHAKYAERLKDFTLKIVPLDSSICQTAAISFDDGTIYLNEGFLTDPATFYQLNVIIRHELLHNLLMHQIRMMEKIGKKPFSHIRTSQTIHTLLNIIEDFEISNKKYSAEDKEIVRHTWLNGKEISGLVTEDTRKDWMNLSVEAMYDKLLEEIEKLNNDLINGRTWKTSSASKDFLGHHILAAKAPYNDVTRPSNVDGKLKDFIENKLAIYAGRDKHGKKIYYYLKDLPENYADIAKSIYKNIDEDPVNGYDEKDIQDYLTQIQQSSPITAITLKFKNNKTLLLVTPEEKYFASDMLNNELGNTLSAFNYKDWYERVKKVMSKYPASDIQKVLDSLE